VTDVTSSPDSPDLSSLFDRHLYFEFEAKDAEATMKTMAPNPVVIHVPVMTGGRGTEALHAFYRDWFIPSWPEDVEVEPLSRTVGPDRVVNEFITRFTHTREMPFWLPGVAPTGRRVELPMVVVMGFDGDMVVSEHIYWDQASLLVQVGLLDPGTLPVAGSVQAKALVDREVTLNRLITR
jgi:carboxymethylenebutenolidase